MTPEEQEKARKVTDKLTGERHKKYLEQLANSINRTYDEFIAELQECIENGYSMNTGDNEMDVPDAMWKHYEALFGPVPQDKRDNFWFSCAC